MIAKKILVDGVLQDVHTPCYIIHINGTEDRFFFSTVYIDYNGEISVQNCIAPINIGSGLDSVSIGLVCALQSIAHRNRGFQINVFMPQQHGDISKHVNLTLYSRLSIHVGSYVGTDLISAYLSCTGIDCVKNDESKYSVLRDDFKIFDVTQKSCTYICTSGDAIVGAFTSLVGRIQNVVNEYCEVNNVIQVACSDGNIYKPSVEAKKPALHQPSAQADVVIPPSFSENIVTGAVAHNTNITVDRPQTDLADIANHHTCAYCARTFGKSFALTNHIRNSHPDKFEEYSKTR